MFFPSISQWREMLISNLFVVVVFLITEINLSATEASKAKKITHKKINSQMSASQQEEEILINI